MTDAPAKSWHTHLHAFAEATDLHALGARQKCATGSLCIRLLPYAYARCTTCAHTTGRAAHARVHTHATLTRLRRAPAWGGPGHAQAHARAGLRRRLTRDRPCQPEVAGSCSGLNGRRAVHASIISNEDEVQGSQLPPTPNPPPHSLPTYTTPSNTRENAVRGPVTVRSRSVVWLRAGVWLAARRGIRTDH